MGIIRINKTEKFTAVSNQPFNNTSLSWEARGVLAYLLIKPNGWVCRNYDLINNGPAGGDKVERILDELQEHGYLTRSQIRKEDGSFDWDSTIHEAPIEVDESTRQRLAAKRQNKIAKQNRRKTRSTRGVLPTPGLSTPGLHPPIVKTDVVSTELVNTEKEGATPENGQTKTPGHVPNSTSHTQLCWGTLCKSGPS